MALTDLEKAARLAGKAYGEEIACDTHPDEVAQLVDACGTVEEAFYQAAYAVIEAKDPDVMTGQFEVGITEGIEEAYDYWELEHEEVEERAVVLISIVGFALSGIGYEDLEETSHHCDPDVSRWECGDFEWLVLTDEEADQMAKVLGEQWVEEFVYSQIPENLRQYFDEKQYIDDIMSTDGRASLIASGSGREDEAGGFYIYWTRGS